MRKAFLVGAGISVDSPSNFPTAFQLSNLILGAIAPTKKDLPFLQDLINPMRPARKNFGDYIRFEQLLESVAANLDADLEILRYFSKFQEPNDLHFFLARRAIAGDFVITTNFDGLLEEAVIRLGATPVSIITNSAFRGWKSAGSTRDVPIFKLHGSFDRYRNGKKSPAMDSMQATLASVARGSNVLSLPKEKAQFLKECLEAYQIWVVGYSGSDDLDIMPTLCSIDCREVVWIEHDSSASPVDTTVAALGRIGSMLKDEVGFRDRFLLTLGSRAPGRLRILRGPTREILDSHLGPVALSATKSLPADTADLEEHFRKWHSRFAAKPARRLLMVADLLGQIGLIGDARRQIEQAWALLKKGEPRRTTAAFMLSRVLVRQGSPRLAAEWSMRAVRCLGARSTVFDRIRAYHQRGFSLYKCGQWRRAQDFYRRAEKMARSVGSHSWVGVNLHDSALILQDRGQYDQAIALYKKSLGFSIRSGNIQHSSWTYYQLAVCSYEQGRFAESIRSLKRSGTIAKTIGDANHVGFVEQLLGLIDLLSGRHSAALQRFRRCIDIDRRTGYSEFLGMDLFHIGIVYLDMGRLERAGKMLQLADRELLRVDDQETRAELKAFQAQQALATGEILKSCSFAQEAVELSDAASVPGYKCRARCIYGLARWKTGDSQGMEMATEAIRAATQASLKTVVLDLFSLVRRIHPAWEAPEDLAGVQQWARRVYRRIGNRRRQRELAA